MTKKNLTLKAVIFSVFLALGVSSALAISPQSIQNRNQAATPSGTMRSCLARESAVKTRMTQLTRLVATMEKTFDKIADRVKTYYTNTVLPSGRTVANYDALVTDITTKKNLVQTEINKAQTDITNFNCSTGDPKLLMKQFTTNMQSVKTALKNYRASINTLIVAVRGTVTPTPTPED